MVSHYGHDMFAFVPDFESHFGSAFKTALYLLTYGGRYPATEAVASLGLFDRAAFETLGKYPDLPVTTSCPKNNGHSPLCIYLNSLGRLHLRRPGQEIAVNGNNEIRKIGYVSVAPEIMTAILDEAASAARVEERNMQKVRSALDAVHAKGELSQVLEQVIDHVKHVEAVGFYVGDHFLARMERFNNLLSLDESRSPGLLQMLRQKAYADWSTDEVLLVAALHALFLSGRSVRFEEFNGVSLTATTLLSKLYGLLENYATVGCDVEIQDGMDIFQVARQVFAQSLKAEGSNWLRYRWICGLNFQKTERLLRSTESTEDPRGYREEFGELFEELVGHTPHIDTSEQEFFSALGRAALDRDIQKAAAFHKNESAAQGWFEFLIEKIVSSAVLATDADYGMSSSLRDVSRLLEPDEAKLLDVIHGLNNTDFYTCFVSNGFHDRLDPKLADTIAQSVQRRMMYNRWHFIPGNLERRNIADTRHWFYPPVLPDLAVHSDVHHGGHIRAQVKYSVRAPGPDMSMSPLVIANRPYRGFYDIRVVRMAGQEFSTDDLLRARRRTTWLEPLFSALVDHLTRTGCKLPVTGFQPGNYYDIPSRRMAAND